MQEEKKAEIKRNLESFQQQLEDLKKENPDGDYEQLEKLIETLSNMLEGVDNKPFFIRFILKRIFFLIALFICYILSVTVMIGFSFPFLTLENPMRLLYIIPIVAGIILISHKVIDAVLNIIKPESIFLGYLAGNLILLFLVAILDSFCFHVCSSMWQAFFSLAGAVIFSYICEYYLTRKFFF